jgi:hypothetical protein
MSDLIEDPAAKAVSLGLEMVLPDDNELLVDFDHPYDGRADKIRKGKHEGFERLLKVARSNGLFITIEKVTESKSGNIHVYLRVEHTNGVTIDPMMRIALQAIFGSDPKRELYSVLRLLFAKDIPPTTLFEVNRESTKTLESETKTRKSKARRSATHE